MSTPEDFLNSGGLPDAMANPPAIAPPALSPQQQRLQRYQELITNFTYSLGAGLSASARVPGGARNRTNAGIGAALTAPLVLQQAREAQAAQRALLAQREAQTQNILSQAQARALSLPEQLRAMQEKAAATAATTEKTQAQTEAIKGAGALQEKQSAQKATEARKARNAKLAPLGLWEDNSGTIQPLPPEQQQAIGAAKGATQAPVKPLPPEVEAQQIRKQQQGKEYTPEGEAQAIRIATEKAKASAALRPGLDPNSYLNQIRALELKNRTESTPGQIVSASTGLPVKASDAAAKLVTDSNVALAQADVVKDIMKRAGDTGAIKGWVLREGMYYPVIQEKLTPEQTELVSEMQRLLNDYVYTKSGKQINEMEMKRLARTTPSVTYTPQQNEVILKHFVRAITTYRDNYLKTQGWKIAGSEAPSPVPTAQPTTARPRYRMNPQTGQVELVQP